MEKWTRWSTGVNSDDLNGESWLLDFKIKIFRILLLIGILFLGVIIVRGFLTQDNHIADLANFSVFVILLILRPRNERDFKIFTWIGFMFFSANCIDGLTWIPGETISCSYPLYPLLVLYGALLGDIWITLAGVAMASSLYGYVWWNHYPLVKKDFMMMTNLFILLFGAGAAATAVWFQHKKLLKILKKQSQELEFELEHRLRMNRLVFHDIINPLFMIQNVVEFMKKGDRIENDVEIINTMTAKILAIIQSARTMAANSELKLETVRVKELFDELKLVFNKRLESKDLEFLLESNKNLKVIANTQVLSNSVLGNFLSNAIKFSERGGIIKMNAQEEDDHNVRITIIDQGIGFSESYLKTVALEETSLSTHGTEGEEGTGYGLMIAAVCLSRFNAYLEIRNGANGGAEVSALLPEA